MKPIQISVGSHVGCWHIASVQAVVMSAVP
jgi:hypothetical protein